MDEASGVVYRLLHSPVDNIWTAIGPLHERFKASSLLYTAAPLKTAEKHINPVLFSSLMRVAALSGVEQKTVCCRGGRTLCIIRGVNL